MTATIAERVAAGAKFLDEHDRDWWKADVERAIDLDTLDLGDGTMCVLGQRCPLALRDDDETEPYTILGRTLSGRRNTYSVDNWARPLGFICAHDVPAAELGCEWADLTAEWKRVITERRSA